MKWTKSMLVVAAAIAASSPATAQNAAGYNWNNVPMGGAGFVSGIYPAKTEQGMVYARTDVGGAYRWDKNASRWVALTDFISEADKGLLGIDSMAVDPKSAGHIIMLAGTDYFSNGKTAVLRSTDYGNTWSVTDVTSQFKTHGNGMGRQSGEKLAFDPGSSSVMYAGTRNNGLFRSTNWGYNWTRLTGLNVTTTPNGVGISMVMPDPASVSNGTAQRLIVGVSRFGSVGPNLYRSDNGGQSFYAINGAPGNLMPQRGAFDGQGNLYITYGNGAGPHGNGGTEPMNQGGVYKYNVNNGSWTNVTPSGVNAAFGGVSVDASNANRVIVSTINSWMPQWVKEGDRIYITTNGGGSWTDVVANTTRNNGGVDWVANSSMHWTGTVVFDPFNGQTAWATSGNGIFKGTNLGVSGTTWTFNVNGLEESVPLGVASVPGGALISVIGDYDGFRHYNTWAYGAHLTPNMGTTTGLAIAGNNSSVLARVGSKVQVSLNSGVNWFDAGITNGTKGQVALSANGAVLLHSPENSTVTYRSVNNGNSWTAANNININGARPVGDTVNANLFYAYDRGNGKFWVSYDGGVNFYNPSTLSNGGESRIQAVPGVQGDIWVPMNGNGIMRSTNSGSSFTKVTSVAECSAIGFGKAATGATYPTVFIWGVVNGVRGVFRSTDAGNSWLRVNDNTHQYGGPANGGVIAGDMNTFGVVYMSTMGRGLVVGRP
jgi:hypothetical protein